ncbi:MAG: hypothetical protein M3069_02255 [Chloroflexota bacterium]|nr:hypothetical protein [Chloroflexota bacterium]
MTLARDGRLAVSVGLNGGAQVSGKLLLRGAGRVVEFLNNWADPTLVLGSTNGSASVVLVRSELVWIAAMEDEPVPWIPNAGARFGNAAVPQARRVVIHAGPFELHGALHTYPGASWPDFLVAHSGASAYFSLADAQITGPSSSLAIAALAVNADRISALLSLE